jgi:hypothetical protein
VCTPISRGWGLRIYLCSTELFWGSGFGIMFIREALWRGVVDSKYGSAWGRWHSNEVYGSYG